MLAEHIVGQELIAIEANTRKKRCFWVRGKSQSQAEVDFLVQHKGYVVPVEVKSGRLRSLHQFMDRFPHYYAVRMYAGPLEIQRVNFLAGKRFYLLNLPYFLSSAVHKYLKWMIEEIEQLHASTSLNGLSRLRCLIYTFYS
ncbi:MAG: DUF4143 domain-containing protein [Deltaproteobacteria bacterium]|nr:DUF4143 domain-containing protein [Deltaproteobacteria bacterium]